MPEHRTHPNARSASLSSARSRTQEPSIARATTIAGGSRSLARSPPQAQSALACPRSPALACT
eukprot:1582604-Alexandrium_andersonii.AAC.1